MLEMLGGATTIIIVIFVLYALSCIKILAEYERGVIFRLGRLQATARGPGITFVLAPVERPLGHVESFASLSRNWHFRQSHLPY